MREDGRVRLIFSWPVIIAVCIIFWPLGLVLAFFVTKSFTNLLANVIVNDVVFKTILNSNCEYVREAI